ncbi:MAG TPA: hypothetical protein VJ984_12630 [Xanthomonadales bacterium]|nr:hypothetical protein [Xanthomonadales bacterium]
MSRILSIARQITYPTVFFQFNDSTRQNKTVFERMDDLLSTCRDIVTFLVTMCIVGLRGIALQLLQGIV